jgi:hypothetical protein
MSKCLTAIGIALLLCIFLALGLPPWTNKFSCVAQYWVAGVTGIYLHKFPAHFTGTYRVWDSRGRLTDTQEYRDGIPHGKWVSYRASRTRTAEYKNGSPWDGLCYVIDGKAFLGEYKGGKPWNGFFPFGEYTNRVYKYIVNGHEVSESEYREYHKIPTNGQPAIGLGYWTGH